jgi:hypothetical protein
MRSTIYLVRDTRIGLTKLQDGMNTLYEILPSLYGAKVVPEFGH